MGSSRPSDAHRSVNLQDLLCILWVRVIEPINRALSFDGPPAPTTGDSLFDSVKYKVNWVRTGVYTISNHWGQPSKGLMRISRNENKDTVF